MAATLTATTLAGLAAGCTSTQEKSRALEDKAEAVKVQKGLVIPRANPKVDVGEITTLVDDNGAAVVVELRNEAKRDQSQLPIAIDVAGPDGKSAFKNDSPGIEASLRSVPYLAPRKPAFWVHDQVLAAGKLGDAKVKVGFAKVPTPDKLPEIVVEKPKLQQDPVDGMYLGGKVRNKSRVEQRNLVLYAIARKGGKVVAAGRGQVERLRAGKGSRFSVFFIGEPKGAEVDVIAPPTVLR